jgi:hypothetical protein
MINTRLILFVVTVIMSSCNDFQEQQDYGWKIGGKIHFEEENGADYIGLKEINSLTKETLKSVLPIAKESCDHNAKILLKRENDGIQIDHYREKSNPNAGEEMHATLLYTSPRGFCNSETLQQVCPTLFQDCQNPINIESVAQRYHSIIKPHWRFKIEEIKVYENKKSITFSAILSFENHENINLESKPISAGLHLTLIQCFDPSIFNQKTIHQCLDILNRRLKGKFIKIADKKGMADLEFGISGQPWRIRDGKRVDF